MTSTSRQSPPPERTALTQPREHRRSLALPVACKGQRPTRLSIAAMTLLLIVIRPESVAVRVRRGDQRAVVGQGLEGELLLLPLVVVVRVGAAVGPMASLQVAAPPPPSSSVKTGSSQSGG